MPIYISSLSTIAHQYEAIILDQFGVIHDGYKAYSRAIETLDALKSASIPVVIVTNSGSSVRSNNERLIKLGFSSNHFTSVVTSGEICREYVRGKKIFLIGQEGKNYGLDDCIVESAPSNAQLAIVLGTDYPKTSMEDYRFILRDINIPMLCGNPDLFNVGPGGLSPGPGQIAKLYEEMGGQVTWIGKPFPLIYQAAERAIGYARKILCIGDSLEHDIQGGIGMGYDTLLVQTGVSKGINTSANPIKPTYIMDDLIW